LQDWAAGDNILLKAKMVLPFQNLLQLPVISRIDKLVYWNT
jgi:hypothetical protein